MATPWRCEIATIRGDRTVLQSTEVQGLSFDRYIGKVGTMSATIPAPNAAFARKLAPLLRDDASLTLAAYISHGPDIWWGGRLGDPEAVLDARSGDSIKITGETFEGYLDDRTQYADRAWSNTEQLTIATDIWTAALAAEGNIGITLPAVVPSGVTRDFTVSRGDKRTLASMLNEVANRDNGFEWMINCYRDGDTRRRALVLGYPIIGGAPGPVYTYPGKLLKFSRKPSTAKTGTRFWSIGGAPADVQGDAQVPIASAQRSSTDLLNNGALLVDKVTSYSDVTLQPTIETKTAEALRVYGAPIPIVAATARVDDVSPSLLGSRPTLRASHPFFPSPGAGSPGYDGRPRVIGMKVKPDERGESGTVEMVFEEVD